MVDRVESCHFYHTMSVPGERVVFGEFDLRGKEDVYLGHVSLAARRVLEIGPANGSLTFHMESRGATVVAVELGPDTDWDIVPHVGLDLEAIRRERREVMERVRNGFWWAHSRIGSRAEVHYGDVYDLPDRLGRFDVAVMAAVLRHTRDPLRIIEACAKRSETIVITEMFVAELEGAPVARLVPSLDSEGWDTWWDFSPELLQRFLEVLGFPRTVLSHHTQRHVTEGIAREVPFFTLVATR